MIKIYGIKNCDTMKKTFAWFDDHGIAYDFVDYKKQGADEPLLRRAFAAYGWENILNRRGMTWRKLPDDVKEQMNEKAALDTAIANPSVIRRPIIVKSDEILIGFDADQCQQVVCK